jgi:hypothetical protein
VVQKLIYFKSHHCLYPKQAFEARPEGRKKRGRPRVKWEENVSRGLQERGVDRRQARKKAMDRSAWRSLV